MESVVRLPSGMICSYYNAYFFMFSEPAPLENRKKLLMNEIRERSLFGYIDKGREAGELAGKLGRRETSLLRVSVYAMRTPKASQTSKYQESTHGDMRSSLLFRQMRCKTKTQLPTVTPPFPLVYATATKRVTQRFHPYLIVP